MILSQPGGALYFEKESFYFYKLENSFDLDRHFLGVKGKDYQTLPTMRSSVTVTKCSFWTQ